MSANLNLSKSLRREIERTARRGPRPEEQLIYKRQERDAKKKQEEALRAAEIATAYFLHEGVA